MRRAPRNSLNWFRLMKKRQEGLQAASAN
jgi:hypothetical protein